MAASWIASSVGVPVGMDATARASQARRSTVYMRRTARSRASGFVFVVFMISAPF
jgi:hypothetical protein